MNYWKYVCIVLPVWIIFGLNKMCEKMATDEIFNVYLSSCFSIIWCLLLYLLKVKLAVSYYTMHRKRFGKMLRFLSQALKIGSSETMKEKDNLSPRSPIWVTLSTCVVLFFFLFQMLFNSRKIRVESSEHSNAMLSFT